MSRRLSFFHLDSSKKSGLSSKEDGGGAGLMFPGTDMIVCSAQAPLRRPLSVECYLDDEMCAKRPHLGLLEGFKLPWMEY